ncbi:deoxyribose-phosphate aldolase [Demequina capsici]|uniref:Deoxyribose-phosphate aldolase n=1 Tax=Demequina capsici TaxID=3075620 RepID=A0AA96FEE2_9MICO|nr:deoxyribose-phosphate aldolase [Demequina sp. PMTSA13]WNM28045.1 deoxyribose-phosphate aldolase [Demequina sp. PMTSA13]
MTLSRSELAKHVDHTLLKPEATPADVAALVAEGAALGVFSVCVSPSMLPIATPTGLAVATVCGFPSGKHHSSVKAAEAALSIEQGADEVDMVIDIAAANEGRFEDVQADVAAVRAAVPAGKILKVIIESAALTDDAIVGACRASEAAGADFVKTSTGFHPAGGASVHAVALMAKTVGGRLGVKASGGIRTAADALAMIEAGATRLGLSGTAAVLDGLDGAVTETPGDGGY